MAAWRLALLTTEGGTPLFLSFWWSPCGTKIIQLMSGGTANLFHLLRTDKTGQCLSVDLRSG